MHLIKPESMLCLHAGFGCRVIWCYLTVSMTSPCCVLVWLVTGAESVLKWFLSYYISDCSSCWNRETRSRKTWGVMQMVVCYISETSPDWLKNHLCLLVELISVCVYVLCLFVASVENHSAWRREGPTHFYLLWPGPWGVWGLCSGLRWLRGRLFCNG